MSQVMSHERLIHDCAWSGAAVLETMIAPVLRDEERREFLAQAYQTVRAAIESFVIFKNREEARLCKPSSN